MSGLWVNYECADCPAKLTTADDDQGRAFLSRHYRSSMETLTFIDDECSAKDES